MTRKALENMIKRCIKNGDYKTANNYIENYKNEFKGLELNSFIKDVNKKPKRKLKVELKDMEEI